MYRYTLKVYRSQGEAEIIELDALTLQEAVSRAHYVWIDVLNVTVLSFRDLEPQTALAF